MPRQVSYAGTAIQTERDPEGSRPLGSLAWDRSQLTSSRVRAPAREAGYTCNLQGLSDPHAQLSGPPVGRALGCYSASMPLSPRPTSSPTAQRSSRRRCRDCHLVRVERVVFVRQPAPLISEVFQQMRVGVRTA